MAATAHTSDQEFDFLATHPFNSAVPLTSSSSKTTATYIPSKQQIPSSEDSSSITSSSSYTSSVFQAESPPSSIDLETPISTVAAPPNTPAKPIISNKQQRSTSVSSTSAKPVVPLKERRRSMKRASFDEGKQHGVDPAAGAGDELKNLDLSSVLKDLKEQDQKKHSVHTGMDIIPIEGDTTPQQKQSFASSLKFMGPSGGSARIPALTPSLDEIPFNVTNRKTNAGITPLHAPKNAYRWVSTDSVF